MFVVGACAAIALVGGEKSKSTAGLPANHGGQPAMELPRGRTPGMMEACTVAGTPGEHHTWPARQSGVWNGQCKMWMVPGSEPELSPVTSTVSSVTDGRFVTCSHEVSLMGMPRHGMGAYGFNNVTNEFECTWIDNHSTGTMFRVGQLSPDKKTLTWTLNFDCPITNKPTTMRQTEPFMGANSKKLEMWAPDPVSGREYKAMEIVFTRAGA